MGRYHYPLPETAAVQSVGLPWLGSGRRASSRACENSHGRWFFFYSHRHSHHFSLNDFGKYITVPSTFQAHLTCCSHHIFTNWATSYKPCSAVSEVKGKESMLQWLLKCLSKPRQGYLQTRANCRSGSLYLPELLIAHA